jgi:hypothetical protein
VRGADKNEKGSGKWECVVEGNLNSEGNMRAPHPCAVVCCEGGELDRLEGLKGPVDCKLNIACRQPPMGLPGRTIMGLLCAVRGVPVKTC